MSVIFISTSPQISDHNALLPLARTLTNHFTGPLFYVSFCPLPDSMTNDLNYTYMMPKDASGLTPKEWNSEFQKTLLPLFSGAPIDAIVFEGNFVYAGLIQNMKLQYQAHYIWLKRPTSNNEDDMRKKYFDNVSILSPDLSELPHIISEYE